ncbi:MAG: hypothetical protein HYX71_03780 [Opitutae bacterium]|nr:hypothetical protein [Opitutae bacterium]
MDQPESDPVVIQAILLSDHVVREAGTGKLTLVGMFGAWNCPGFPFQTPSFFATAVLSNFQPGTNMINVVLRVEQKQTGLVLVNSAARAQIPEGKITPKDIIEIPFKLPGIVIPQQGEYRVVVLANDEKIGERHFIVNLAPPVQQLLPPT